MHTKIWELFKQSWGTKFQKSVWTCIVSESTVQETLQRTAWHKAVREMQCFEKLNSTYGYHMTLNSKITTTWFQASATK